MSIGYLYVSSWGYVDTQIQVTKQISELYNSICITITSSLMSN